jgi:hypothetical protein
MSTRFAALAPRPTWFLASFVACSLINVQPWLFVLPIGVTIVAAMVDGRWSTWWALVCGWMAWAAGVTALVLWALQKPPEPGQFHDAGPLVLMLPWLLAFASLAAAMMFGVGRLARRLRRCP